MKTLFYIIQKEFIQIFRDKTILPILFILPIVQLIILVNAANLEMQHIKMYIVDKDLSSTSRQLCSKFEGSPFFHITEQSFSIDEAEKELKKDNADIILHIPKGFEKDLLKNKKSKIQLLINAINGTTAGLINYYSTSVIIDFNKDVIVDWIGLPDKEKLSGINVNSSFWYNPEMKYKVYMLPGILVILVTIIGMFLTALNIVREKEMGTIEQINVTPIKKHQFIIGKLIPFWLIGLFEFFFGLLIGYLFFDVPVVGSLWLLLGITCVYLFVVLGLGLLLSTISQTQQQVMFIAFFFMLVFILMSGIFTSTESMPDWAQKVNVINPFLYFMRAIRMILLKGSDFFDIMKDFIALSIYAVIAISMSVWMYRKRA
ncbi:MAG: ABC transporter permease [Saprospiraceae bacterium]|nr:ABC transporter permease [Saprospiraceae bacterium]